MLRACYALPGGGVSWARSFFRARCRAFPIPIVIGCAAPSTREVRIAAKSDFRPLLSASAAEADARLCHHHLPPRPYAIDMTPKTTVVNM